MLGIKNWIGINDSYVSVIFWKSFIRFECLVVQNSKHINALERYSHDNQKWPVQKSKFKVWTLVENFGLPLFEVSKQAAITLGWST